MIRVWVRTSLFVVPRRPGLTRDEIEAIALEAGYGRGELQDALDEFLDRFQDIHVGAGGRYWYHADPAIGPTMDVELVYFLHRDKHDPRNVLAFDFLYEYFAELAKHGGKDAAIATESQIVAAGVRRGLSEHDVLVAIGALGTDPALLRREGEAWRASASLFTATRPGSQQHRLMDRSNSKYETAVPLIRKVLTRRDAFAPIQQGATAMPVEQPDDIRSVAIMFLDAVGWSKLEAADIKKFVTRMFPEIQKLLVSAQDRNTWGDAVVATFASETEAAKVALAIRDLFQASGDEVLPSGLTVRIALHRGQVMHLENVVRGTKDIFGHAVHVAARLESVTAAGQVFCTAEVARALLDVQGLGPRAHRLGQIAFPKGFGTHEVFVVTRNNEPAPHVAFEFPEFAAANAKGP